MVEYKPKFNPADNAEVVNIASKMPKSELEDYYVKDRNKRHSTCGDNWGIAIGTIIVLAFVFFIISGISGSIIGDKVENSMQDISQEVCPYLGNGFVSSGGWDSDYFGFSNQIVCDQTNSGWRGK